MLLKILQTCLHRLVWRWQIRLVPRTGPTRGRFAGARQPVLRAASLAHRGRLHPSRSSTHATHFSRTRLAAGRPRPPLPHSQPRSIPGTADLLAHRPVGTRTPFPRAPKSLPEGRGRTPGGCLPELAHRQKLPDHFLKRQKEANGDFLLQRQSGQQAREGRLMHTRARPGTRAVGGRLRAPVPPLAQPTSAPRGHTAPQLRKPSFPVLAGTG